MAARVVSYLAGTGEGEPGEHARMPWRRAAECHNVGDYILTKLAQNVHTLQVAHGSCMLVVSHAS